MPSRARAGNLTAALVLVAFLELVLNRLASRLFLPQSMISNRTAGASLLGRVLGDSGPFLFHLTGVLAFLIFLLALGGLLRRRELFPRPVRFTVTVIALCFWFLGTAAVLLGQIPRRFVLHLETSFAFLALLTAAAFLGTPTGRRVKLGVLMFALPGALYVLSIVLERIGWLKSSTTAGDLARWGEACLLVAAASAPLTLVPRPLAERRWLLPLAIASALTALLIFTLAVRYDLVQATALYGLHLEMPRLRSPMGLAYLAALFGWTVAVVQLLGEKGGTRLAGYGLLLLAIAGYQLGAPVELSTSLLGLLALSVGELRAAGHTPGPASLVPALGLADWRTYVGQLAAAATDGSAPGGAAPPEAIVVDEDDLEVSHVRGHRRSRPVDLRFLRRRGRVVEFEIAVGDPGHREPNATVERHRSWLARSPEQRLALPRTRTGDAAFDQKFSVHGQAPLGSDALRREVMRQGDGVLSLWQGTAARYRAVHHGEPAATNGAVIDPPFAASFGRAAAGSDGVIAMLDTLIDLVEVGAQGAG
jgi:hypothetical protein